MQLHYTHLSLLSLLECQFTTWIHVRFITPWKRNVFCITLDRGGFTVVLAISQSFDKQGFGSEVINVKQTHLCNFVGSNPLSAYRCLDSRFHRQKELGCCKNVHDWLHQNHRVHCRQTRHPRVTMIHRRGLEMRWIT